MRTRAYARGVTLVLKLLLAPGLIAAVTVAARRWGPRIGGWLNALPMVAGPVLFFLALEQGDRFLARAATATLAGLVGVAVFALAYAWASLRASWRASLLAGWLAFGTTTLALQLVAWRPEAAFLTAVGGFLGVRALLPPPGPAATPVPAPPWDLPARMASAVVLVLGITGAAARLGPGLSGALTPFPVATAILLAFTHAQQGRAAAIAFLRGFLPAMAAFAIFCLVLALAAEPAGRDLAFASALAAQLGVQGLVLLGLHVPARGKS